jgi:hypothetical protein
MLLEHSERKVTICNYILALTPFVCPFAPLTPLPSAGPSSEGGHMVERSLFGGVVKSVSC